MYKSPTTNYLHFVMKEKLYYNYANIKNFCSKSYSVLKHTMVGMELRETEEEKGGRRESVRGSMPKIISPFEVY